MIARPSIDERVGLAADFVCRFAKIVLEGLATISYAFGLGMEQLYLIIVIEAGVYWAVVAVMVVLRSIGHELFVGMDVSVCVVNLVLAKARREIFPSPALVA
jgi:hypothetical protein